MRARVSLSADGDSSFLKLLPSTMKSAIRDLLSVDQLGEAARGERDLCSRSTARTS